MDIRMAAAATLALGLALGPIARADDKGDAKDKSNEMTIHGIVSGVTVEGETVVDYKAKKAVEIEGVFLTVVGMPAHHHQADAKANADHKEKAGGEKSAAAGHHRANVYTVWLTPKTKVCSCCDESGQACDKKETSLSKLEIGDRVEVKFARRDESASNAGANHSEAMRAKHGRHRIYSVDAQEITIMPAMHGENASATHESKVKSDSSK